MADVSVVLEVQDRMTASLNRINDSVNNTTSNFEHFGNTADEVANKSFSGVESSVNKVNGEVDNTNKQLEKANKNVQQLENSSNMLGGIWKKLAGLAGALYAMHEVKQAIDYASDLVEVQNVVDVTFGNSAETVNKWSKEALNAYGLNELSAKRYSSTLGAMMKSSGLAGDEVMDMSMKMTELAGDMASFYNLSGDMAFEKIKSGISGETEPLKALGINMSDANLQAYAYATGINKLTKDMSQAEKVQLRYNYLMSVTKDAQGDFARTSDSFSNQTKLLAENWKAFMGELASNVLPILGKILSVLNDGINKIKEWYDAIKSNWSTIAPIVTPIAEALFLLGTALTVVKVATVAWTTVTTVLNAVLYANPLVWIIGLIIGLVAVIVLVCDKIAEWTGITQSGMGMIVGAISWGCSVIWNIIATVFNGIINFIYDRFVNPIAGIIEWWVNAFSGGFDSVGDMFLNLLGKLTSWLLSFAKVATKVLDAVFGSDLTGGLENLQNKLESMGKNKNAVTYKVKAPQLGKLDTNEAWKKGADFGDNFDSGLTDIMGMGKVENAVNANTSATNATADAMMANDNKNAKGIKKSVDISKENLVYLRDIAEKEAINQFTTAEVKVDMTNNNTVNNGLDLNTMVKSLSNGVREAMQVCADGVY